MRFLKWVALLEGTSLLVLLFIAMPLKYHFGWPQYVSLVGQAHGVLFILFNLVLFYYVAKGQLTLLQGILGFIASLIPFGTFYYKAKVLNK